MQKIVFFLSYLFLYFSSLAQEDTCSLRISLLTCSPGEELYSTFGHTALRVIDRTSGNDFVFNYGTFEFSPDFYMQFVRGKLMYYLSVEHFQDFLYSYQLESRSVVEQEMQLTCEDKKRLFTALQINAQKENRAYRYDFLYDNCSTRPKDIVVKNVAAPVQFKDILPPDKPSFRNMIHTYLDRGGQYWSKFGIDILLGMSVDKKVTNEQAMFLPDYTLKGFDSAVIRGQPLVTSAQAILSMPSPLNNRSLFRPVVIFTLVLALALILFFVKKPSPTSLYIFDFIFFFFLGLCGFVMLFMWFGTDHVVCRNNLNLLWALPTHIITAFALRKEKVWIKNYFKVVMCVSAVLAVSWAFLPQQFNSALLPIILLIIFRSWDLSRKPLHATKRTDH